MAIRFLTDENLNNHIVRGLFLRLPLLDLVRVQDVGLTGADDPVVLAWAAKEERILLTHDVSTITRYAYERIQAGYLMPGVIEIGRDVPIGLAIEDLVLIVECSAPDDWTSQVHYLPLR